MVSIQSDDYENTYSSVGAIRNSDVFTAISIIASDIASSPIQSIKDSMPQLDDEIAHLMNDSPNPIMDGWHFKYALRLICY